MRTSVQPSVRRVSLQPLEQAEKKKNPYNVFKGTEID